MEKLYHEFDPAAPFAVATLLASLALVTLAVKTFLEWKAEREERAGQEAGVTQPASIDPFSHYTR